MCVSVCVLTGAGTHTHRETMGLEGEVYLYHKMTPPEGTGTWPDYLVNRVLTKMRGHIRKNCTEIEKQLLNEQWGCGSTRTVDSGLKWVQS